MTPTPFPLIPDSTVQLTNGSYTIPANRYAVVKANAKGGGTVAVNGGTVLSSDAVSWSVLASSPIVYATSGGVNAPGMATAGSVAVASATGLAYNSGSAFSYTNAAQDYNLKPGDILAVSASAFAHIELYKTPTAQT